MLLLGQWINLGQLLALDEGKLGLDPSLLLEKLNQQAHWYLLGQLPLPLALDIDLHIEVSNLDQMYQGCLCFCWINL